MGCLRNILRAIIITLAAVGFMSLGGKELVTKYIGNWLNPPQDVMLERAKKVGDFSQISEEFEIERAAGIMGYNAVVAEHKASGQKFFVVDSNDKNILTKEDLQSDNVEEKLKDAVSKIKHQSVTFEELKITKHGTLNSYGTNSPYVKFDAKVKKLPVGEISGIISAVDTASGEKRLLVALNEKDKYSQLISDEFFKKIK